mmetsp:Transcript_90311/g.156400  ORF Transcript_90311/g.156400 Transcript_90311/m.156400 type:complete len:239 (-) Transcript_90311:341-1057(-)
MVDARRYIPTMCWVGTHPATRKYRLHPQCAHSYSWSTSTRMSSSLSACLSTSSSQGAAGLGAGPSFNAQSRVYVSVTSSHRDSAIAALRPATILQKQMERSTGTASSPSSPSRAMFEDPPPSSSALRCSGRLRTTKPEVWRTLTWTLVGRPVGCWLAARTRPPWARTLTSEVALAWQVYTAGSPVWPVQSTWKPNGSSFPSVPSSRRRSTRNTETKDAPSIGLGKVHPSWASPGASAW